MVLLGTEASVLRTLGVLSPEQGLSFLIWGGFSVVGVFVMGVAASVNGMLTFRQMRRSFGAGFKGIPFMLHPGMWGDDLFVSPMVGFAMALYADQWTWPAVAFFGVLAIIVNEVRTVAASRSTIPDSLAWQEDGVTAAGWIHEWYSNYTMTVLFLFAFCDRPDWLTLAFASIPIAAHMAIGPVGIWAYGAVGKRSWAPPIEPLPMVLGPWFALGCIVLGNGFGAWEWVGHQIAPWIS